MQVLLFFALLLIIYTIAKDPFTLFFLGPLFFLGFFSQSDIKDFLPDKSREAPPEEPTQDRQEECESNDISEGEEITTIEV